MVAKFAIKKGGYQKTIQAGGGAFAMAARILSRLHKSPSIVQTTAPSPTLKSQTAPPRYMGGFSFYTN
jgi:hypothetical protein